MHTAYKFRCISEELGGRVQETAGAPDQALLFLLRVVGDPDMLRRLASSPGSGHGQDEGARVNRPGALLDSREEQKTTAPPSSSRCSSTDRAPPPV